MRKNGWLGAACLIAASCALWAPAVALPAGLPDGRGYELVSPPDKAGGSVAVVGARTRAAVDGSAIMFISLTAFGDAPGSGVETEYMAQRIGALGTPGWSTHGVIPKQDPLALPGITAAGSPGYLDPIAPDLSTGIFRAWSPLTNTPDVANVENLYVRRDLRTPGQGSYSLVTTCPRCAGTGTPLVGTLARPEIPVAAGASEDFEQVLFESRLDLTGDGSGVTKVYLSDNGAVRLIGKVPPGDGVICGTGGPACVLPAENDGASMAGLGAKIENLTPNVISDDGTRVNFTAPASAQGLVMSNSNLYQANSHGTAATADDSTVRINVSERTGSGDSPGAVYETASTDGSRVFFLSQNPLTNDAPAEGAHIYMWDRDHLNADGGHLTLIDRDDELRDATGSVIGMIGASDDGTYVYFVANSQLVPGADLLESNRRGIYLWHNGTITYIGSFTAGTLRADWVDNMLEGGLNGLEWTFLRSRVTSDGKAMLFAATNGEGLTGYDHTGCGTDPVSGCMQLYVYHAENDRLACATCPPSGVPATSNIALKLAVFGGNAVRSGYLNRPLTEDGRRVLFSSAEPLVPHDTNGKYDAYQYDTTTGTISLLSSGKSTADSYFLDASATGDDVFFATKERLLGWDVDDSYDIYDARINGGFPEPLTPPALCNASTCQGPLTSTPPSSSPNSSTYAGPGNVTQRTKSRTNRARKCRKGKVRRKIAGKKRCVKKKRTLGKTPNRTNRRTAR